MDNDNDLPNPPKETVYSVKIDDFLHKRLEKHLRILKHLDEGGKTKQQWIKEALKEKLEQSNESELLAPKESRIAVRLNEAMNRKVEKKVELRKKLRDSYSKKQLIVEAINEKLEKEEVKTKQFLEEFQSKS